jgi:two-component system sensor histidine kinase KdpD
MHRPDPDALVRHAQAEEAKAGRGRLKIFFGASAGVGKTFAMLRAARQLQEAGADVVVGLVETHGRRETKELVEGLELLPRKVLPYRGHDIEEFDIDAALKRRPAVILIDELAHTNAPGSRHPKRWQDIEEILSQGVDVYSTLNVQHLESLNDVVGRITGIRVGETVPDRVFDAADEITLVDLPAEELLQRLNDGKVYMPEQATRAAKNFFRKGNLIALRELALRRTANRVDDDMAGYRVRAAVASAWHTRDRVLACVGPAPGSEDVLRSAARLASALNADWHAVYVETPAHQAMPEDVFAVVLGRLKLAEGLGASTSTISGADVAEGLITYARRQNITKIILGRTVHSRWRNPWTLDLPQQVERLAPDIDLVLVGRAPRKPKGAPVSKAAPPGPRVSTRRYVVAVAVSAATSIITLPFYPAIDETNIAMLFLASVLPVALYLGRGPAVATAVLNVLAFDILFVQPRFSFAVSDAEYLITFLVMFAAGLLIASLASGMRFQTRKALSREEHMRDLYQLARDLSAALTNEQISGIVVRAVKGLFGAESTILLPDSSDRLQIPECPEVGEIDTGIAQWSFDRCTTAGAGTDTLPGSAMHYLPLKAPMRARGVLAIQSLPPEALLMTEDRQQLETLGALAAIALERVHFVTVAQETLLKIESGRLRESMLNALSHDLKTPLASMQLLVETLLAEQAALPPAQHDLVARIHTQVRGMSRIAGNLLDMARLEAGPGVLRPDWQHLEELIGTARNALGPALDRHRVLIEIPADFPLLHGDGVLLERVFANLLENGGKYVPAGAAIGIHASVKGGQAEIDVWDEGPGLPKGQESDLFEKFVRGRAESSVTGVGLGLAICRAIIDAHGGSITAENRPEGGACFRIRLPLKTPPELEPEAMESELEEA